LYRAFPSFVDQVASQTFAVERTSSIVVSKECCGGGQEKRGLITEMGFAKVSRTSAMSIVVNDTYQTIIPLRMIDVHSMMQGTSGGIHSGRSCRPRMVKRGCFICASYL
jgi:hypothetical protein